MAESLLCCPACSSLAVPSINFCLLCSPWLNSFTACLSHQLPPSRSPHIWWPIQEPSAGPGLALDSSGISQNFPSVNCLLVELTGAQLRLLLGEDLKSDGGGGTIQAVLALKGEGLPLLPSGGILSSLSFPFLAFNSITLILLRQQKVSGQGVSPV